MARGYAFDKNFIYNLKLICIFDPEKSRYQYEKVIFQCFFADIYNNCGIFAAVANKTCANSNYELQRQALRRDGLGCRL